MDRFCLESDVAEIVARLGEEIHLLAGKTVLMTGACGFLGHYFTSTFSLLNKTVLERPLRFIGLDNLITASDSGDHIDQANFQFFEQDVIQGFEWDEPLDYVIHAAGIASPFHYRAYPLQTLEVGFSGTQRMLELATKHRARFILFSSSEIYGDPDPVHVPTPESYRGNVSCYGPRSCYDEAKRVSETLCYIFHTMRGTSVHIIRPFNVYGPGMLQSDYRVMPNFASRLKARAPLRIYGSGNQTRTFCYVTDALVGFLRVMLLGVPGEAYNIGNHRPEISMLDLAERVEAVVGRPVERELIEYPDTYPSDEPIRRCPDIRKARLQLHFEPQVEIEEGLRRFLSWSDRAYTGEI